MASWKESSEVAKNLIETTKAIALLAVLGVLLYYVVWDPQAISRRAATLHITKMNAGFAEFDLTSASDALPENKAALSQANATISQLRSDYQTSLEALRQAKAALATAGLPTPRAVIAAEQALTHGTRAIDAAASAQEQISRAERKTTAAIASLPGAQDTSVGFAVVFGADKNRDQAETQLGLVKTANIGMPHLFLRQGFFRSALSFASRSDADAALPKVRALGKYAAGAYVVNLASWCPAAQLEEDPVDCGS